MTDTQDQQSRQHGASEQGEQGEQGGTKVEGGRSYRNRLYPEDQQKVDAFNKRGINSVERKPFRPLRLLIMVVVVVVVLSAFSQWLASFVIAN